MLQPIRFIEHILETLAAPFLIVMGLALLVWAYVAAGGFGEMLSTPSQFGPGGEKEGQFWSVFFPSLTAMVGFWATLSLNIPDFSRFAESQKSQIAGQIIGLQFQPHRILVIVRLPAPGIHFV